MKNTDMEDIIQQLTHGTPREIYHLYKQLINLSDSNIFRLAEMLNNNPGSETETAVLEILGNNRINNITVIDLILRKLRCKNKRIRSAASRTLLRSSPKLKNRLNELNDIYINETDEDIKNVILQILSRYKHK